MSTRQIEVAEAKVTIEGINVGVVAAVHNGDNNTTHIYGAGTKLTPRRATEETQLGLKANWENSGTCQWLLKKDEFSSWLNKRDSYLLLWIQGPPGCGKTTLMSRVVEYIRETENAAHGPNTFHLLYFYVDFGNEEQKKTFYKTMLMTFCDQMLQGDYKSSNELQDKSETGLRVTLAELLVKADRDLYIVIDALDQIPQQDERLLVEELNNFVQRHKKENKHRLSVIVSSRNQISYKKFPEYNAAQINVKSSDNSGDIKAFLTKTLNSDAFDNNPALKQVVLSKLMDQANGIFLWAKINALNINNIDMPKDIEEAVERLGPSNEMKQTLKDCAANFESLQKPFEKQTVLRALAILSQTTGSMAIEILLAALSIDLNDGKVDREDHEFLRKSPYLIIRLCKHVIELNDSLGVFRFYHSYVFDFFRNHEPLVNNGLIAQLCLAHLSSTDFSRGPFPNAHWYDYKNIGPVKKHPFLEFASCNWFVSAKKSVEMDTKTGPKLQGVELLDNFRKLFQPEEDAKNLQLSFQIHRLTIKKSIPDTISHEHIISYFALHEFFDLFRKQGWLDLKRRDSEGLTAMHWAICNEGKGENENEAVQTIEKLIHFGGKISAKDNEGCTPLYYAAHYGNQSVLQLLLQKRHRAKLNARNNENETALIAACKKHHEKIVEELLEAGANVRIVSSVGTALHMVSMIGCNNCVEKVLKKYGRRRIVESESPFGTALHVAAFHGHINVVRLLCDRGLNIHATHEHYGSVLTAAATGGHRSMNPAPFREIFLELIKRGVDVNDKNGLCGPALRAAAYYGHIQLVEILLNNHATISAEGPMGTAYEAADSEGYQDIKELLLKWDPQAASYGDRNLNNAMNYQKLQQFLFKGALKASNMYLLNSLVEQVETYFEKRLEKGQTALFVNMLDLGKLIFTEVIDLSISSDKKMLKRQEKGAEPKNATYKDRETKSGEEEVPIKSSETTVLEWLRNSLEFFFSSQIRIKSDHKKYGFRVQSSFGRDGVDGRFPQVLDRLTQAAVRILEHAIFNGRPEVIKLIAETWIDTLNTLVERDESGELLKSVVESRVAELQKHLSNSKLTPDRRFKKAEGLACVGIELLFTAARQEEKYKQLAFILSKMWASALESVEDFGEEGQGPIRKLIQVFIQKFTATIQNNDRTNVEIWQRVGIEILRGTALQPRRRAMAKVSGELTKQLSTINEMKMEDLVKDVLESKLREYKDCLEKRKYEEALGLVLAVLELIRVAIEQGDTPVLVGLLPYLNKGVSWTMTIGKNSSRPAKDPNSLSAVEDKGLDTELIFDFVARLFHTAEQYQASRAHTQDSASLITECLESMSDDDLQHFIKIGHRRIEGIQKEAYDTDLERSMLQIARAAIHILNNAKHRGAERNERQSIS